MNFDSNGIGWGLSKKQKQIASRKRENGKHLEKRKITGS
jgi:hypothetical protein